MFANDRKGGDCTERIELKRPGGTAGKKTFVTVAEGVQGSLAPHTISLCKFVY